MSTSGTYDYAPSLGELTLYAFNLCGIRPMQLTQEHMSSARTAANLMQASWAAKRLPLWAVDQQTINLVEGQATYDIPADTISLLDAYISSNQQASSITNRLILPISRSEYASIANPQSVGAPNVFWFDRLIAPKLTLWLVPDGSWPTLTYYRVRQIQDANLSNGSQPEIQFYFLEAYATGLARRLSQIWAPDRYEQLKAEETEAFNVAANQNVENSAMYVSPMLGGYYRA